MKKLMKWAVKILLLLAVLAVAGLITLRLMFPAQKIKQMTLDYAKNHLHREISFDSVSFNLIGVTLNNFAMSEDGSFANGTFVQAKRLAAKAAFWPLLKKQIQISSVYVDGMKVNIRKDAAGVFNFATLASSTEQTTPAEASNASSSSDIGFTARRIEVTDCDFYYTDLQSGLNTSIEDLNIQLSHVDLKKPFPVLISFTSQTKGVAGVEVSVPVSLALNVFLAGLDLPQAYVEIAQGKASYKNAALSLQGRAENFQNLRVDLSGAITGLDQNTFIDFLPQLPRFTLPQITLKLLAQADLDASTAQIEQASLSVLDSSFQTSGQVNWGSATPTYRFSGNLLADIAQMVKMAEVIDVNPKGKIKASFTATDKKQGKDVTATITLQDISVWYPPFALAQTNGSIKMASLDDISCERLTGSLNGEKFTSSFSYKNIQEKINLNLNLDLAKLLLKQLPSFDSADTSAASSTQQADSSSTTEPETEMNITAHLQVGEVNIPHFHTEGAVLDAALKNVTSSMRKTDGTVGFTLQPGAITDMDEFIKQSKVAKIILLPLGLLNTVGNKLSLNLFSAETQARKGEIAMTKAQGHYTFTNGNMKIDTTAFESSLTDINATGTIDFATNQLDMKASATLITKQTPLVIKITGTLDNPSGKVDVLNTVGSVVGGILSYKTAKSAVTGTVSAAGQVAGGAAKTTGKAATTTAKGAAGAAKMAAKALGGLFKSKEPTSSSDAASDPSTPSSNP